MLEKKELKKLSRLANTNQTTVLREYLQLLFLSDFYKKRQTQKIFFKGGTAIRLIYNGNRFSEDLDFTVNLPEEKFKKFFEKTAAMFQKDYPFEIKERESLQGKKYLLTAKPQILNYSVFINLDFSFRERVQEPKKSMINTHFPVVFSEYVYHLSKDEILAEKIRAVYSRKKGRDIYDLWYLLNTGAVVKPGLIRKKLNFDNGRKFKKASLVQEIQAVDKKDFIKDLKPFVINKERDRLGDMYEYLIDYLQTELKE